MPGRESNNNAIEKTILRVILQQNPVAQGISVLFGAIAVYGLIEYAPGQRLFAWLAALAALAAWRIALILHYGRRDLAPFEIPRATRRFTIGLFLAGIAWAVLPWLVETDSPVAIYFIALLIAGLLAGATVALALKSRLFFLFTLPQFLSIVVYLLVHPVPLGNAAALMLLVLYAGMWKAAAVVGREVRNYLHLQLQAKSQRTAVEGQAAKLVSANAAMKRRREMLEGMLRIATQGEVDSLQRMRRLLEFGCNALGMRTGVVADMRGRKRQVFLSHDPLGHDNRSKPAKNATLCSLALNSEEPFQFANAAEARSRLEPRYTGEVAGAYVGARIHASDGVFGTLSFQDPAARSAPFTETELDFVKLLAGWVGAELSEHFAQRRLRDKERQLSTLADAMPCGMAALDAKGRFVYVNRLFEQTFNPDQAVVIGRPVEALLVAGDANMLRPFVDKALAGEAQEFEYRAAVKATPDEQRIYRVNLVPNVNEENDETACFVLMVDITEDKARQTELELKASLDPLTHVYNRKHLEDTLEKMLSDRRRRKPVYVALLDLDGFKQVNDTAGHDAGDTVLRDVASMLRDGLRKHDMVARYGGDEFVVLLHCVDDADVRDTCGKMLEDINSRRFRHADREFVVGMSIGVTRIQRGEAMHHLLVRADSAMYLAKRRGRNRIEIVAPDDSPVEIRNRRA